MFWWRWPSWIVESISGVVLGALLLGWDSVVVRLVLGLIASVGYEVALDRNGWSLRDVLERQPALTIVSLLPFLF